MSRFACSALSACLALSLVLSATAAEPKDKQPKPAKPRVFTDPAEAGVDFADQGEYVGVLETGEGAIKFGVQVIALGDGKFRAVACRGGLPGDGWDGSERSGTDGERKDKLVAFNSPETGLRGELSGGKIEVKAGDKLLGTLKKVERKSPTLGKKPPEGAVVLFDGTNAEKFIGGRMTKAGLLQQGTASQEKFQDFSIHLEFLLPFQPYDRGQGRGNSGFYAQGRYEVQILDSFGLSGENNECGGLYTVARPLVNLCYPPLSWQTYDVDFTAPQFKDGKKLANAKMTVRHNGVLIHKDVEVPNTTTAAIVRTEGPEPGPVYLQDHGNPVRFRNIWVVKK
jgi:hypothetical protein